jgi:DNA transposition AAA+ family ATPase
MTGLKAENSPLLLEDTRAFLNKKMDTPDMKIVRKAFDACRATRHTDCVLGMAFVGASGVGKTTTTIGYADKTPPYEEGQQRIVPVLYVNLPEKSTSKSLVSRLLRKLTGLKNVKGTEEDIQARLISRLIAAKTEMIFIDEAQHLVRESSSVLAQHSADAIKAIMDPVDGAGIPVVCVGLDSALSLLNGKSKFSEEKQLKRRNRKTHRIAAYPVDSDYWVDLIKLYQSEFKCKANLSEEDMLKRLHVATNGLFGNITPLIQQAIEIAGSSSAITKKHLASAYEVFQPENELGFNPFVANLSTIDGEITTRLTPDKEAAK